MKTKNSFSINFFLKMDKANRGTAPLYARITVNGSNTDLSVKRRLKVDAWDRKAQRVTGHGGDNREIKERIRQVTTDLNNAYDDLRRERQVLSANSVKAKFEGTEDEDEKTLLWLISYHNTEISQLLEPGTMKNYYSTERFMKEFLLKKKKVKDVYLSRVNLQFVVDFEIFLRQRKPDKGQRKCSNNTVMKHFERLHKMFGIALNNDWIIKDPFKGFSGKIIHKDREALEVDELEALWKLPLEHPGQAIVRDMFLFSCYTGLAYADICRLNETHIIKDSDGEQWIEMVRKKTKNVTERKFFVLLLPEALELMQKYKDHPASLYKGATFPYFTNQATNRHLKTIAEKAGISKELTFHIARHTFATTITLENGVSMESVSKMLGHATIRTTQIYSKVKKKKIGNDMRELREKMKAQRVAV